MNNRISSVICALALLCVSACASHGIPAPVNGAKPELPAQRTQQFKLLAGRWTSESKTKEGLELRELAERASDGTYKITFRTYQTDGTFTDDIEAGLWGISGGIYFTMMKGWVEGNRFLPADPRDPSFDDAYTIIELSADTFRYKSLETGDEWINHKVDGSYSLPERP